MPTATATLGLPDLDDPNAVRVLPRAGIAGIHLSVVAPTPPDAPPPPRRIARVHFTPFAHGIPTDAPLGDPCRWATYGGVTPDQLVARLCERLRYQPWDLQASDTAQGEVAVYIADPGRPLALVWEGLTAAEAKAAIRALTPGWRGRH